ncbi:hypothetical protein ACFL2Q_10290 [Thermodesulfobacteriota bacterium]
MNDCCFALYSGPGPSLLRTRESRDVASEQRKMDSRFYLKVLGARPFGD